MLNNSKSYHYIKSSLCFLFMLISCKQFAQQNDLFEAQRLCHEKKFDQSIVIIDKVIVNPETSGDHSAWYIRSYAYLHYFKQLGLEKYSRTDLIDTAVASAVYSIKLDKAAEYKTNNEDLIKSSAASFYKLCTTLLQDSLNSPRSEAYYLKYKKYTALINPEFDFKQKDLEYYNTTGSLFADMYMKNNFNQKYGDIAKTALLKVLEIDNKNISANINLGILYYNQGATLMRMMDYDVDLAELDVIQENAKKLFKQSLPFMIKVYELDPKAEKALESLQGIYSALLDEEKANEFKQKKEALNKK